MTVKLSAIEGLMLQKSEGTGENTALYNQAIDLQGSKQIGLNRERLAAHFYNRKIKDYQVPNDEDILECTADAYRDADAIIRDEATLLEVKNA